MNPGDAIVADNASRLLDVNPKTGTTTVVSDNDKSVAAGGQALFSDLFGVAREPDGNYAVIARRGSADPGPNPSPSRLIRVNATTGAQTLVASNEQMHYSLTSLTVAPKGDIYFGDEDVPDAKFNGSVVYRADAQSGALSVLTSNSRSDQARGAHTIQAPLGLSVAEDGHLWVLADAGGDQTAPDKPNDFVGAIVQVDVLNGKQTLFTSNHVSTMHGGRALFADPRAFVRDRNGDFYVTDDAALNSTAFTADDTKVIKVDHATGAESLVSDNARSQMSGGQRLFNRPYGIAIEPDGQLLLDDGDRLLRVDPQSGAQSLVTSGLGDAIGLIVN